MQALKFLSIATTARAKPHCTNQSKDEHAEREAYFGAYPSTHRTDFRSQPEFQTFWTAIRYLAVATDGT